MPCDVHSWWFDAACPECVKITAPVTEEDLAIPEFLQRNPDNTMRYPDAHVRVCADTVPFVPESTLADRQEHYRAAYEADKRKRTQERIAKLKTERKEKQQWELTRKKRPRT